jgi:two-component system capsular synthesis sensor histidine kinase RcsC
MGGTGLGLSIVKHFATAMKGDVSVDSAPGQGATFLVTLPVPHPTDFEKAKIEAEQRRPPELTDSAGNFAGKG